MPKRLIMVLIATIATLALASQVVASEAETENPLEPLDVSSPRAAIEAFVEQAGIVEERALDYRANRSGRSQDAFFEAVARTGELSDLTEVAAAAQSQVVLGNFAALADILMRIPLPDPDTIPDADQVAADELAQWTLPGTEDHLPTAGGGGPCRQLGTDPADRGGAPELAPGCRGTARPRGGCSHHGLAPNHRPSHRATDPRRSDPIVA